jgi:hypothetical protein
VSSGDTILRGAALLLLLASCSRPTEVELRLFPCGLAGALPVAVDLDVQGYDAEGAMLTPLHASFAVAAGVLGDGYATVGLRRPPGIATADFTLTWHDATGDAQVVMHPALVVPKVGEVLELGAEMCAPVETTSSGGSSTGEGTSTGSSTGSSTGMGTESGTGSSTSSGASSSTGEGTSTGTSTGDTSGGSSTGEPSMAGDACSTGPDQYFCEHGGSGELGKLLECVNDIWTEADIKALCVLDVYCPASTGLVDPVAVGCSGMGAIGWACVCQDKVPLPCVGDEMGCSADETILLCIDDGMGMQIRTRGSCVSCVDSIDGPQCSG